MKVEFLPKEDIEFAATKLMMAYGKAFSELHEPPIPVDAILECHLGLSLDFDSMDKLLGQRGVLGATWIDTKEVIIDEHLDPSDNPTIEGRYRFTLAHEIGHWELHRHQVVVSTDRSLFCGKPQPSIICRSNAKKDPIEWQADCFASYLLMPVQMVENEWKKLTGDYKPIVVADEIAAFKSRFGEDESYVVNLAKQMAQQFEVSGQAMQIRLTDLDLLRTDEPERGLFD